MSTLMSKDLNLTRPSTRVAQNPGGASSVTFGDASSTPARPPAPPAGTTSSLLAASKAAEAAAAAAAAAAPAPAAVSVKAPVSADDALSAALKAVTISPTYKAVGLAIASPVGAEYVAKTVAAALAAKGVTNVVVSHVASPALLPFLVKSMVNTTSVVLAVAVLTDDSAGAPATLASALLQVGLDQASPVVPAIVRPASLLALKASTACHAESWAGAVFSALAIQQGALKPAPVASVVSEAFLAAAAPAPVTAATADVAVLVADIRNTLKPLGARGPAALAHAIRAADVDGSGVDLADFTAALGDVTAAWTPAQVKAVFDGADGGFSTTGKVPAHQLVEYVRGDVSERRAQVVLTAFQSLGGYPTAAELHAALDGAAHPDVLAGRCGAADVAAEFQAVFGPTGAAVVTPADFVEFYSNVSAAVDSDDVFELAVRSVWGVGGADGWAPAAANKRVLVNHANGLQSVVEVVGDLSHVQDTGSLLAFLAEHGVDAESVDNFGLGDLKAPAPVAPAPKKVVAGILSGVPVGQERTYVSVPLPNAKKGGDAAAAGGFTKQEDGYAARSTSRRVQGPQAQSSIVLG